MKPCHVLNFLALKPYVLIWFALTKKVHITFLCVHKIASDVALDCSSFTGFELSSGKCFAKIFSVERKIMKGLTQPRGGFKRNWGSGAEQFDSTHFL